MSSSLRRLGFVAAFLCLPLVAAGQEQLQKSYTDEELVEILKSDGYRAVEISEDRVITIKIDGLTYVLFVYDDDDLQLYLREPDADWSLAWDTTEALLRRGYRPGNIYLSMERNMSCGIGQCGHCRLGKYYICKEGPVFSYDEIQGNPRLWDD